MTNEKPSFGAAFLLTSPNDPGSSFDEQSSTKDRAMSSSIYSHVMFGIKLVPTKVKRPATRYDPKTGVPYQIKEDVVELRLRINHDANVLVWPENIEFDDAPETCDVDRFSEEYVSGYNYEYIGVKIAKVEYDTTCAEIPFGTRDEYVELFTTAMAEHLPQRVIDLIVPHTRLWLISYLW
jgi:hypothetical protein